MMLPESAQIHYRCVFNIRPEGSKPVEWGEIVKTIRGWIGQSIQTNDAFFQGWLFRGGRWKPAGAPRIVVESVKLDGSGTAEAPQYWAVRFENPCAEVGSRQWRTDIGITSLGNGCYRVSLVNLHWLQPGFLGEEPPAPMPTAPRVVRWLLDSDRWSCWAGSERLATVPRLLAVGDGRDLRACLAAPDRHCPVILLAANYPEGSITLDTRRLAKLLAGTATVVAASSSECDEELEWLLPGDFRCWNGMVRIYQPGLTFENPTDGKRHRWFKRERIAQAGGTTVEDMIVRSVARRSQFTDNSDVVSLEDVAHRGRELRLEELKAQAGGATSEEITLLWEDNTKLAETIRSLNGKIEAAGAELEEAEGQAEQIATERDYFKQEAMNAQARVRTLEKRSTPAELFEHLPSKLIHVVDVIAKLFPDRIVFSEEAIASAKDAAFNQGCERDIGEAWSMLWHAATTLHSLHFDEEQLTGRLDRLFQERCGIQMALTEGKQTKADSKLVELRTISYGGETLDISPHLKYDRPPRFLRIHYAAHHQKRLIVVGHCGDHLTTAGTRRRR